MTGPATACADAALLHARGLACERGGRRLFAGLDLDLRPGEVVWLRGTNGRGKTSLLRLLAGLGRPLAGQVRLGADTAEAAPPCWIAHANALKEDLTALEALRFVCALAARPVHAREAREALARLGMAARHDAAVRTLSQGQRRRVALARLALSLDTPLWLLDEPFDALDERGIEALKSLLREHAQAGGASLLTSHQDVGLKGLGADPAVRVREISLDALPAGDAAEVKAT